MEEAQLAQARELVGERLGLEFPDARDDELCAGLLASAARLRLPSVETLLDRLAATGWRHREWGVVASRLTIGETCFFRNAASFEALKAHVLEPLIAERRRQGCRMLSLWSAGCASGEEAYSLAILIDRLIPDREDWLIRILATDINPAAMAAARAGIYRAWSLREVPPQVRQLYFVRRGTRFEIAGNIRDRVSVAPLNLAAVDDDSALGLAGFDLILCRNVLMYLLPAARQRAIRRLAAALAPSGWLMTAPAEAVPELFAPLSSVVCGDAMLFRAEPPSASRGPRAKQPLPAAAPASPAAGPRPRAERAETGRQSWSRPARAPASIEQIEALTDRGLLAAARRECKTALAADPTSAPLHRLQATICEALADNEGAVASLRSVLFLEPNDGAAHFALARLLLARGVEASAQRSLTQAMRLGAAAGDRRLLAAARAALAALGADRGVAQ